MGPAWLAGATQKVLGFGLTDVLFGAVPALCTLSAIIAVIHILTVSGVPRRLAAAAVAIAACLPLSSNRGFLDRLQDGPIAILTDMGTWPFASGLMLNSYLGIAVGMSSLALLFDRRSRMLGLTIAGLGLASLIQLKPQYFVSIGCVAGFVAIFRASSWLPFAPNVALGIGRLCSRTGLRWWQPYRSSLIFLLSSAFPA